MPPKRFQVDETTTGGNPMTTLAIILTPAAIMLILNPPLHGIPQIILVSAAIVVAFVGIPKILEK